MIKRFFKSVEVSIQNAKALLWPFDKKTWLKLFLLYLLTAGWGMQSPGCGNINLPSRQSAQNEAPAATNEESNQTVSPTQQAVNQQIETLKTKATSLWNSRKTTIIWIAGALGLLIIIFLIFMAWLSCRFRFIVLESLRTRNVEIRRFWRETKELGNSLFWFNVALGLIAFVGLTLPGLAIGWAAYKNWSALKSFMLPLMGLLLVSILFFIVLAFCLYLLFEFLPVVMHENKQKAASALRALTQGRTKSDILRGTGYLFFYLLMATAIGIGVGIFFMIALIPIMILGGGIGVGTWLVIKSMGLAVKIVMIGIGALLLSFALAVIFFATLVPSQTFLTYLKIELVRQLFSRNSQP